MPIQLDKIMSDIAEEKALHPVYSENISKKDIDEAWQRVGKKNKLSVHEARSIFKVLQKKYEQEKAKNSSSWKLFSIMEAIHKKMEDTNQETEEPVEEEEFIEMLDVEEDDVDSDPSSASATTNSTPDKDPRSDVAPQKILNQKTPGTGNSKSIADGVTVLHKMGLIVKKTAASSTPATPTISTKAAATQGLHNALAAAIKASGKPSSRPATTNDMKRKLSSDSSNTSAAKKTAQTPFPVVEVKQEPDETTASSSTHPKINVITIPGNPASNGDFGLATASSTNGFSPRIEDIDFRNEIIFDGGSSTSVGNQITKNTATSDLGLINLGNFDNQLPPMFFKNLCNSNRYEALGLYVANVLNRFSSRNAAKLELNILRAIVDAKSDEMEQ